jgi:hypothetical protein
VGLTSIDYEAFDHCTRLQTVVFGGSGVAISARSFPYGNTSLKAAYEAGATGSNKGVAGTYKRDATGNSEGRWARQAYRAPATGLGVEVNGDIPGGAGGWE